jgi:CheY-like chemotaxis protein
MDEGTAVDMDTVVYLKDMSVEEDTMVILIGSNDEFREATKILPQENLAAYFVRPFDMRQFVDKMKSLTDAREIENRKSRILIVDDDVTFLKMAYAWLKDKYRVSIVNSGVQAITWLAKNKADVVLLDYEMPVVDGPGLLEMLKSETGTDSIPVFFLTGKSDLKSVKKVMELKPQGYLLKASGKESLLNELEKFFLAKKTMK